MGCGSPNSTVRDIAPYVAAMCIGKATCLIYMSIVALGDPCSGFSKNWGVQLVCSLPAAVPVCANGFIGYATYATLTCPAGLAIGSVPFALGGGIVAGACGAWTVAPAGNGVTFNYAPSITAACVGKSSCVVPMSVLDPPAYDFAFSFSKNYAITALCVPVQRSLGTADVADPRSAIALSRAGVPVNAASAAPNASSFTVCVTAAVSMPAISQIVLSCPAGTVVTGLTALSGSAVNAVGACSDWTVTTPCLLNGLVYNLSVPFLAWCTGLNVCTIPWGTMLPLTDFCFGYPKFVVIIATCAVPAAVPLQVASAATQSSPSLFRVTACATGPFQATTTGTVGCPAGYVISSVVAVAGGGISGSCPTAFGWTASYTPVACNAGPGIGRTFVFSANVTAACAGRTTCTFAANTGTVSRSMPFERLRRHRSRGLPMRT